MEGLRFIVPNGQGPLQKRGYQKQLGWSDSVCKGPESFRAIVS